MHETSGAMSVRKSEKLELQGQTSAESNLYFIDFKASDSNATYSGSKIQAPAIQLLACVRA